MNNQTDPVGEQRVSIEYLSKAACDSNDDTAMMARELLRYRAQSAAAAEEKTYNDGLEDAINACRSVGTIIQYVPQRSRTGISQRKSNITDFVEAIRKVQRLAAPAAAVEEEKP